jgi:hypothetical protein
MDRITAQKISSIDPIKNKNIVRLSRQTCRSIAQKFNLKTSL